MSYSTGPSPPLPMLSAPYPTTAGAMPPQMNAPAMPYGASADPTNAFPYYQGQANLTAPYGNGPPAQFHPGYDAGPYSQPTFASPPPTRAPRANVSATPRFTLPPPTGLPPRPEVGVNVSKEDLALMHFTAGPGTQRQSNQALPARGDRRGHSNGNRESTASQATTHSIASQHPVASIPTTSHDQSAAAVAASHTPSQRFRPAPLTAADINNPMHRVAHSRTSRIANNDAYNSIEQARSSQMTIQPSSTLPPPAEALSSSKE